MPIPGTLGASVGTEIELVVTVNLILVLWLRVYDSQEARQEELEKQIAQITDAELVSEFTTYTRVFGWVRRVRRWLWLAGAGTGVASAALLYVAVYLSYTSVLALDAGAVWVSVVLGFAAFTSPGVLSLMFLLGAVGNMVVKDSVPQFERWNGEKEQALKDRDRLDEVIARAQDPEADIGKITDEVVAIGTVHVPAKPLLRRNKTVHRIRGALVWVLTSVAAACLLLLLLSRVPADDIPPDRKDDTKAVQPVTLSPNAVSGRSDAL